VEWEEVQDTTHPVEWERVLCCSTERASALACPPACVESKLQWQPGADKGCACYSSSAVQFVYLKEAFCPSLEERVQVRRPARCCENVQRFVMCHMMLPASLPKVMQLERHWILGWSTNAEKAAAYVLCTLPQTLYDAFGVDGRLVVNYALTPAWG